MRIPKTSCYLIYSYIKSVEVAKIMTSTHFDKFLFIFQAVKKFRRYWSIIFYIISIIMNTLSFFVMTMKHNRHLSTCAYMSIIALNDNVVLSVNFHRWLEENTGFHVLTNSGCKIIIYLVHVVGSTGAFEIVLMTLDKVTAIKMPHKSAVLCTARRAKILSAINLFTMAIFYLPNLDFSRSVGKSECARYVKKGWYVTVYSYIYSHCRSCDTSCNVVCNEHHHNYGSLEEPTNAQWESKNTTRQK